MFILKTAIQIISSHFNSLDTGVQAQTETVWKQTVSHAVPVVAFLNKMDREGANFSHCLESIKKRLSTNPIITQLPLSSLGTFGHVDLISRQVVTFLGDKGDIVETTLISDINDQMPSLGRIFDAEYIKDIEQYRRLLIETLVELDDEFAEVFSRNRVFMFGLSSF